MFFFSFKFSLVYFIIYLIYMYDIFCEIFSLPHISYYLSFFQGNNTQKQKENSLESSFQFTAGI